MILSNFYFYLFFYFTNEIGNLIIARNFNNNFYLKLIQFILFYTKITESVNGMCTIRAAFNGRKGWEIEQGWIIYAVQYSSYLSSVIYKECLAPG